MNTGNSVMGIAVSWCADLVTGQLATSVAILAVAGIGVALMRGRLDGGHLLRVLLASFILFGAPEIARGLMAHSFQVQHVEPDPPKKVAIPPVTTPAEQPQFDPYAGAALLR